MFAVLEALCSLLIIPLTLLNIFGALASGIWLAILGNWSLLGTGLGMLFLGGFGLGFAMMPGLLFATPGAALLERGNKLGYVLLFLNIVYTFLVLSAWCSFIIFTFAKAGGYHAKIPSLIWAYGVATGPIVWLARQDNGNSFSTASTFFLEISCVIAIIMTYLTKPDLINISIIFGISMSICAALQFGYFLFMQKAANDYPTH